MAAGYKVTTGGSPCPPAQPPFPEIGRLVRVRSLGRPDITRVGVTAAVVGYACIILFLEKVDGLADYETARDTGIVGRWTYLAPGETVTLTAC